MIVLQNSIAVAVEECGTEVAGGVQSMDVPEQSAIASENGEKGEETIAQRIVYG